ncbi:hypothetical protein [Microvirga tunisiensis]|uniref:Uncharacterized protein n=1 Tax=Microvirga tunisiensis TaxID=2108360 RepID=A0A5N7MG87_9HYPH|nr:hypothetical protein [Microvirga tunisiensis]MPR06185.1 hypothetical protein [Microvirga tunisiensis]MPR26072.1 hypothetical protein [Microvirga tunisiensis]
MWRYAVFAVSVVVVFVATWIGSTYLLPYFFPTLPAMSADLLKTHAELLKVLSAALATVVASLFTSGTSVVVAELQRRANLNLETHKGRILQELEDKKFSLSKDLEAHKNVLAAELDKKKQELGFDLDRERKEFDASYSRTMALHDAISEYRQAVNALRLGLFERERADAAKVGLDAAVDFFPQGTALRAALESFRQRGLYLTERSDRVETPEGQRKLWREPSKHPKDAGAELGRLFAADAELALSLLRGKRQRLVEGHDSPPGSQPADDPT